MGREGERGGADVSPCLGHTALTCISQYPAQRGQYKVPRTMDLRKLVTIQKHSGEMAGNRLTTQNKNYVAVFKKLTSSS